MYYLNYFWLCTFLCVWMGTWCLIMIFMWIVLVAQAETKSTVEAHAVDDPPSARFTWTIDNFSRLNTKKLYSDVFFVGGYKWYLDLSICYSNYIHIPGWIMFVNWLLWAAFNCPWQANTSLPKGEQCRSFVYVSRCCRFNKFALWLQ